MQNMSKTLVLCDMQWHKSLLSTRSLLITEWASPPSKSHVDDRTSLGHIDTFEAGLNSLYLSVRIA